jgi:linoleoyl-CoA desaturase
MTIKLILIVYIANYMSIKYSSKDSPDNILKQIKLKVDNYFVSNNYNKNGNAYLAIKFIIQVFLASASIYWVFNTTEFYALILGYLCCGFSLLILGINFGHDGAHGCLTGNKTIDGTLFQIIYALQGLGGYMWQIRHNSAHHIFPNVYDRDSDLEMSPLILLNPKQDSKPIHKYQHIYATFLYMVVTLFWIFFEDFIIMIRKDSANARIKKIPMIEWVKIIGIKIIYLFNYIALPCIITDFSLIQVTSAFLIMHLVVSVFLTFTFFISHHIQEVKYVRANEQTNLIENSWLSHQINTTIDFHPNSYLAHFIFGGFNTHIAHHVFPDVCHIHYPAITKIIRETLVENNVGHWYKSFTFIDGVKSHIKHLKVTAHQILSEQAQQTHNGSVFPQ